MDTAKVEEKWAVVNIEALSRTWAEDMWKKETKNEKLTALYDIVTIEDPVTGEIQIVREVSNHWANVFWNLKEETDEFIGHFIRIEK